MADDADRAEYLIEQAAADGLAEVRRALDAGPRAVGVCLYCAEPLPPGRLFCDADCRDADCRDAYDHEQRLRRMQGVA